MLDEVECPICGKKYFISQIPNHCIEKDCQWIISEDLIIKKKKDNSPEVLTDQQLENYNEELKKAKQSYESKRQAKVKRMIFEGNGYLGIATSEESDIYINNTLIGKTDDKFIAFDKIKSGKYEIEAKTKYKSGIIEVELKDRCIKTVKIDLKDLLADIRAISMIGMYIMIIDNKSYKCPILISGLTCGKKRIRIKVKGIEYSEEIELLPNQDFEYKLTKEKFEEEKKYFELEEQKKYATDSKRFYFEPKRLIEETNKQSECEKIILHTRNENNQNNMNNKSEVLIPENVLIETKPPEIIINKAVDELKITESEKKEIIGEKQNPEISVILEEIEKKEIIVKKEIKLEHFIDNEDYTITDSKKLLMWTYKDSRNDLGKELSWNEANEYVSKLKLSGYEDWRIPTVDELLTLYDEKTTNKDFLGNTIYLSPIFAEGGARWYWSNERIGTNSARFFGFSDGSVHEASCNSKNINYGVRAVRYISENKSDLEK